MNYTENSNSMQPKLPSAPRNVIVSGPAKQVRGILYGVSILLIVMVALLAAMPIQLDLKLQHGAQATGVVTDKYMRGSKSTTYHVEVRFPVGGRTVDGDARVKRDEYEAITDGDSTVVTYLPSDPSVCKIGVVTPATTSADLQQSLGYVLPNVLLAIFGPLLIEFVILGQMRLLRTGREATATVDEVAKGEKQTLRVKYSFEAEGRRWTGTSSVPIRKPVTTGQLITVVYPPGQPQKSKSVSSLSLAALRNGPMPE